MPRTGRVHKITPRRQFVAWLRYELERRGERIPEPFSYRALEAAVRRTLLREP